MVSFDPVGGTAVAVIGMACRFPGDIDSPERLWDALDDGAGFDIESSPQHPWPVETACEAVEHAGISPDSLATSPTSVFAVMAADQIADALRTHGPALTVDTGLLAVHLACGSLDSGESDLALAGEGTAMVLLKRLPDALRDGDRVLSVVRGTAAGRDDEAAVYRKALARAGVDPSSIGMTETGVLGLMTVILAVRHGQWAGSELHRAAVSAVSESGTRVCCVVERAPQQVEVPAPASGPLLFALSATSSTGLHSTAGRLADWVQTHQDVSLPDLAYTLARRRGHRPVRTAVIADTRTELGDALRGVAGTETVFEAAVGGDDHGPVWVFAGQVPQRPGAAAELLANEPAFAATVALAEPVILRECGFSVTEALTLPDNESDIRHAHATLFTMQVALAAALREHGARPGAVIGYSLGETAAAVVAGALSLEDGLRVVCSRANLLARVAPSDGAVAAVELPAQQLLSELAMRGRNEVVVAAVPSPGSAVVAGSAAVVRDLIGGWEQREVPAREIPGVVAVHSPQVDSIVSEFTSALSGLNPMTPQVPFYTATSFDPRDRPACDARYWVANLRKMARFSAAVRAALEDGHRVFAEVVPDRLLTEAVEQTARSLGITPAILRVSPDSALPEFVGSLYCAGAAVDFAVRHPSGTLVDAPLPTSAHPQPPSEEARDDAPVGHTVAAHPLLGVHVLLPEDPEHHVWQAQSGSGPALSGAVCCEMALAAGHTVFGDAVEVRDIALRGGWDGDADTVITASATGDRPGPFDFVVSTGRGRYASAVLRAPETNRPTAAIGESETIDIPAGGTLHTVLEACFRAVAEHQSSNAIRLLRAYGPIQAARYCRTRVTASSSGEVEADLDVLDQDGAVLLEVRGVHFAANPAVDDRLLTIDWRPRAVPDVPRADPGRWLLIGDGERLGEDLESLGAHCMSTSWSADALHHEARGGELAAVVVLLEPDLSGLEAARKLLEIIGEVVALTGETPRLYVMTRSAQAVLDGERPDLSHAGIGGLLRALGGEHPGLQAVHVDLDAGGSTTGVARQLLSGSDEDVTAWRSGQWYTARLTPAPLRPEERRTALLDPRHDGLRVQVRAPGAVEVVQVPRIPPGPGQIEVAVRAAGVNVADVRAVFAEGAAAQLGTDFAGVVTSVGPGVTDHRVGDRVAGICAGGSWGTFVTCDARLAVPLPAQVSDRHAAAAATAGVVALHGLAGLAAGDKVLIHSAAGGVGQAAIAIARSVGAEIFATAGSESRRELLRDMGIQHVYDSRSADFAALIRADTDGYGVDVVLNSLDRTAFEVLAPGGRFIDIGRRDEVRQWAVQPNQTVSTLDLVRLADSHPVRVHHLLTTLYRQLADGVLPLPEYTAHPLADAIDVVTAERAGRLVLDIPSTGTVRAVVPPEQVRPCRADGAYLVTGGPAGLLFVEWLAAAGAGRIVLCSPTTLSPQSLERIEALRATGTDVVVECADAGEDDVAEQLVGSACAAGHPLRGVLHAETPDATELDRVWASTVQGAWNLHAASTGQPLDWFCMFSSTAALTGAPGQSAAAAASSWLAGFAWWRRNSGLPGLTVAAQDDALDASVLDEFLRHDRAYSACAPNDAAWLAAVAARSPFGAAVRASRRKSADATRLRAELAALPRPEWSPRLRALITDQVSAVVHRNIDADRPLPECGIDSLGALELITRLEAATGIRVRATEITTIRGLADMLSERLDG